MTYYLTQLGQSGQLGISNAEVRNVIQKAPKILQTASEYTNKVAALAPRAIPIIRELIPFLSYGPRLAPLAAAISSNVATILKKAPSYAPILQQTIELLVKAPELAQQIAAITGSMANVIQRIGEDPELDLFVNRLTTIINLYEMQEAATPRIGVTPTVATKGIGLKYVVPWLDRGIYVMQHKWILAATPIATLTIAGFIGYLLGRHFK